MAIDKDLNKIQSTFEKSIKDPIKSLSDYDSKLMMEIYDDMKNKSLSKNGAKEEKATKGRKKVEKSWFRRFISAFIIFTMLTTGVVVYDFQNNGFLKRKKDLYDANNYMNTKIEYYLDEAGINYKKDDGKIIIIDEDKEKIIKIYDVMEEDNFKNHEINYVLYKTFDYDSLDKTIQTQGYSSFANYLNSNFILQDGSVKKGSERIFENMVEEGYVANVNAIKNGEKGVKYGK